MKRLGVFVLTLSFSLNCFAAVDQTAAKAKLNTLVGSFFSKQKSENSSQYWEGEQELHPIWDLMYYLALLKTGNAPDAQVYEDAMARLQSWQLRNGAWSVYPNGKSNYDVTASVVAACQYLQQQGIYKNSDLDLTSAVNWLKDQNSTQKDPQQIDPQRINIFYRIFLTLVGVFPPDTLPEFSPKFIGLHQDAPMSVKSLGIFRTLFVPIVIWRYYIDHHDKLEPLDDARIKSNGSKLGSMGFDSKLFSFINAGPAVVINKFGGDWNVFSQFVSKIPIIGQGQMTDDFWAQEAIGFVYNRQQDSGAWYTLGTSLVNMIALHTASVAGIDHSGRLEAQVRNAAGALANWRLIGTDKNGHHFIPAARSNVWDTSLALQDISLLDSTIQQANRASIDSAVAWLINARTETSGDWAIRYPLAAGTYANWAFYPEAHYYPDTDCTASVLEVLTDFKAADPAIEAQRQSAVKKGFNWLLSLQNTEAPNNDGGFPAWEKNNSQMSYTVMRGLLKGMPRVSDFSQADVSARILRLLSKVQSMPEYANLVPSSTVDSVCKYLNKPILPPGQGLDAWEGDWISDYTYGTAEVLSARLTADKTNPGCISLDDAARYLDWLTGLQNADGGWGESNQSYDKLDYVSSSSAVMQTDFVLKALLRYEELYQARNGRASPYRDSLDRGINFLLEKIGNSGEIDEKSFTAVYVKSFLYSDYTLMPQYHSIGVLSEYLSKIAGH